MRVHTKGDVDVQNAGDLVSEDELVIVGDLVNEGELLEIDGGVEVEIEGRLKVETNGGVKVERGWSGGEDK